MFTPVTGPNSVLSYGTCSCHPNMTGEPLFLKTGVTKYRSINIMLMLLLFHTFFKFIIRVLQNGQEFFDIFFLFFFQCAVPLSLFSPWTKKIDLSLCCRKTAEGTYINTLIQSCIPAFSGTFGGV